MPVRDDYHMGSDDFRKHGHAVIDWIADYLESVERYPVKSRVAPGDVRAALPEEPPGSGESFEAILEDMERVIVPGLTHWQSPNFFGFFPANTSGPSILGELLSAGLGVQGMLWATSPACTELETHVLDWLVEMLDLPPRFSSKGRGGGVIQDSASSATLCALLAARERILRGDPAGSGPRLTVYASNQAHSSVEKAVRIAGLGASSLRLVDVDDRYGLRPDALDELMRSDAEQGARPCMVVATVGTTSSTALDDIAAAAAVASDHGAWLHVDAAMSGTAALCPEFRYIHEGLDRADSYCFNPHKWMFVNFDCDCFYVADRSALINALSVLPEYLRNEASETGAVIDYRDWQVPLGRRFRALKLWFVIRHYGVEGLRHHVREHVGIAQRLASWIEDDPDFELAAPAPLSLVCFRHVGGDEINERLLHNVNASGEMFLTHTKLDGRYTLRMSIGQTTTRFEHVEGAWARLRAEAGALARG